MSVAPVSGRDRWTKVLVVTWSLVGIALLLAAAGWLFGKVAVALVPFLFALLLVFLFRAPVGELERRGLSRGLAVGLCYLIGLVIVGTLLGFLLPVLVGQVRDFIVAFPDYYQKANDLILGLQQRYQSLIVPSWFDQALANLQDTVTNQSAEWSKVLAKEVFTVGGSAITLLGHVLLALVIAFWVLKDLPIIRREAAMLAGPKRRDEAALIMKKVSRILSGYLRGQLILSVSTGTLVAIGLTLLGVPYSLVIGVLAGLLNVIPWIGPALTAVIAGIAAAFVSPWHILFAVLVEIGSQQVTEIFIQPRVMSEQVDLHPLLVIFSLLTGAALFGFTGIVLAIPVAAVSKGLFVYYFEKYTDSKLTSEDGALFKTTAEEQAVTVEVETPSGDEASATVKSDGDVEVRSADDDGEKKVSVDTDAEHESKERK
jgi:predicted PurR-regulated permease PerM